jgi:hypothetical protein
LEEFGAAKPPQDLLFLASTGGKAASASQKINGEKNVQPLP